ncbi:MAG TPA: hypothetical protein VFV69_00300, partial [Steroidobacteraceae bacterium]|nr:hypothetical protein [Steroidobacteraceae bacterium]
MIAIARPAMAVVLLLMLAGCGGGGGGDGGPQSPPPVARGAFTLSATNATFHAKRLGTAPADVELQMTVTGSDVAAVGAAYRDGVQQAPWLAVTIEGTASPFTVSLAVNTTDMPAALYGTTITVGTADAGGTVLQAQDVQVTYSLLEGLT